MALTPAPDGLASATAVLSPEHGLVSSWATFSPSQTGSYLWAVTALLNDGRPEAAGGHALLARVGAYGADLAITTLRAAGEVVERSALLPCRHTADDALMAPVDPALGALDRLGEELPGAGLPSRPGELLATGRTVPVPIGLIDYPGAGPVDLRRFDPSPSGAAAGLSAGQALRSALLEVVERDAVQVAWSAQLRLEKLTDLLVLRCCQALPALGRLASRLNRAGVTCTLASLPTACPGLVGALCVLEGDPPSTGAKVATDWPSALLGALQEALQVGSFLSRLKVASAGPGVPAAEVTDDVSRALYWCSTEAATRLQEWCRTFVPLHNLPPAAGGELCNDDVARALDADGAGLVCVDLTSRLPASVSELGWRAVKVLAPGYQRLRMSEQLDHTWALDRVQSAPRRTGLMASPGAAGPHPLI